MKKWIKLNNEINLSYENKDRIIKMILKVKTFISQIKPSVGSFTNRMDCVKINK